MKKKTQQTLLQGGLAVLVALAVLNAFTLLTLDSKISKKIEEAKEANKPAKISLTVLSAGCADCYNIDGLVQGIKDANVEIEDEQNLLPEDAQPLISQYNIQKLPAIIIEGETDKLEIANFEENGEALVFANAQAPFYNTASKEVEGRVRVTILEAPECESCIQLPQVVSQFVQQGVVFQDNIQKPWNDAEVANLISNKNVKKVPAMVISDEIAAYPEAFNTVIQAGFRQSGTDYVFEATGLHVETETGNLRGVVDLTMIVDEGCEECYDVGIHRTILQRAGMQIGEEKTHHYESAEAQALITKYSIDAVPMVVITKDIGIYDSFRNIWLRQNVGTVEDDGAYVFRNAPVFGAGTFYRDLTTGEIVGEAAPDPSQTGVA